MGYLLTLGSGLASRKDQGPLPPFVEAALFLLCGIIIGAGSAVYVMDHSVRDFLTRPDLLPDHLLARMSRTLDLNEEQRVQAEEILARRFGELDAVRRQFQPEVQDTLDRMRDDVAAILNAEQRATWLRNYHDFRAKWQPGPLMPTPEEQTALDQGHW